MSFSIRLISFSILPFRSIHVVENGKISFFFMAEYFKIIQCRYVCVCPCIYMCVCIHTHTHTYMPYLFKEKIYIIWREARVYTISLKKIYLCIFRERGWEGEREGEKHPFVRETIDWVASHTSPTRDLACNPGICPD